MEAWRKLGFEVANKSARQFEGVYRTVRNLAFLYRITQDPDLEDERTLVFELERTLAKLSGHQMELSLYSREPVTGLPTGK